MRYNQSSRRIPITLETSAFSSVMGMPANVRRRIREAIETRLSADPLSFGKVLRYSLRGSYRLRVGDFRVLYTVQSELHLVTVIAIKHRRIVYD